MLFLFIHTLAYASEWLLLLPLSNDEVRFIALFVRSNSFFFVSMVLIDSNSSSSASYNCMLSSLYYFGLLAGIDDNFSVHISNMTVISVAYFRSYHGDPVSNPLTPWERPPIRNVFCIYGIDMKTEV